MNAAVVTARGGSKSIPLKNLAPVAGKPILTYPIQAAQSAALIDEVYLSTDDERIAKVGGQCGATILWRPEYLATDTAGHAEVIQYACRQIQQAHPDLEVLVILLGNTVMIDGPTIDQCVQLLMTRDDLDSVMTVWQAADDHPYRALTTDDEGLLLPFPDPDRKAPTNRQEYPTVYFYDNGVWAIRPSCVNELNGRANPWTWMGQRCLPVVRDWVTGRDVHGPLDLAISEWWVS